jgi:hypothetical protein
MSTRRCGGEEGNWPQRVSQLSLHRESGVMNQQDWSIEKNDIVFSEGLLVHIPPSPCLSK